MDILVGTSGWSYDDWVGNFYPERLRNSKAEWLGYYGQFLSTVEINSTFYRVPEEYIISSWVKKAKKFDAFEFSLKLPQKVTHEAIVNGSADKAAQIAKAFENKCILPLAKNELLGSVLIQLSPYFSRYDPKSKNDNLTKIRCLFEILECNKYNYAVEFRHNSWLNAARNDLAEDALELLNEFNIANCQLDGPGFPRLKSRTSDHGYIRFHGQNSDIWFKGKKFEQEKRVKAGTPDEDPRMNRYDYLYTAAELKTWQPEFEHLQKAMGGKTRVYFNNHP
jgi:uncharacterized protein YecE (DUF72 family)